MKAAWLLAAVLLQANADGPRAEPKYMRYERVVTAPAGTQGNACAVVDAAVFEHAAGDAAQDVRLFDAGGAETPYLFTQSSAGAGGGEQASVENLGTSDGRVVFDLRMPKGAYSEVDLELARKDFVAVADVTASGPHGETVKLGTFTLFDLSAQKLGRSTVLGLAEATFPLLHVSLRFATPGGEPIGDVDARETVLGATVPPSREAQTLYTTIDSTNAIVQDGRDTVARFHVAAKEPVERVTLVLDPSFEANFVRTVAVEAHDGEAAAADHVDGEVSRTRMRPVGLAEAPDVNVVRTSVDAVIAANLHDAADVTVRVRNGDDKPLPIRAVMLAMRQRKICFSARGGATYTLRYGDAGLRAPRYDYAQLFDASAPAAEATLGPEAVNAQWTARADARPFSERHPELIWVALVGVVAVLGATALASVRRERNAG